MSAPFCLGVACDRETTCDVCLASHERYVRSEVKRETDMAVAVLRAQGWTLTPPNAPPPAADAVSIPQGMSVTVDADGSVWLHIEAPSGRKASICLDALAVQRGGIVGAALLEWTDALAARG
jgi:hypothetical protein